MLTNYFKIAVRNLMRSKAFSLINVIGAGIPDACRTGGPRCDRESGQITPSVVIAMRVDETTVLEDGYRESISTIGSGSAVIFQNGVAINATWHKDSKVGQITFTDAVGADIPLVRGQPWIAAVPNDGGDVTWN